MQGMMTCPVPQLLRPEEVEILVCGSPELDMSALQKVTQYEGYSKNDLTVRLVLCCSMV